MAWNEKYVTATGSDTYANASNSGTPCSLATAIANVAAGDRVNVRAGTYANTTTTRTFATAGTTTAPIWWRGYNAAIGDLDNDPATAKPSITFTTGVFSVTAGHQIFSNLSIVGTANTGSLLAVAGGACKFDRLRVDAQSANASARAVNSATTASNDFSRCWFKATSTATETASCGVASTWVGCVFEGGGDGLTSSTTGTLVVARSIFRSNGSRGLLYNNGASRVVLECTFYGAASDGIRISTVPTTTGFHQIANCEFISCGGYGINNSSGANTNIIHRWANVFYNNTSGPENGFGDSPSFAQLAETAVPFANAAGGDFSLVAGSAGRGVSFPFENLASTSYADAGAVQHFDPSVNRAMVVQASGSF